MYKKLPEGQTAAFDVDHTLVIWEMDPVKLIGVSSNSVEDLFDHQPKSLAHLLREQPEEVLMNFRDRSFIIRPIYTHVLQLVQQKIKGLNVVVWSASGSDWAEAVVNALKLDDHVDVIQTKPHFVYDDGSKDGILGKHYFFAWDEIREKMNGLEQRGTKND